MSSIKFLPSRKAQKFAYSSGVALLYHIDAVHQRAGFDPNCPACIELQKKFLSYQKICGTLNEEGK